MNYAHKKVIEELYVTMDNELMTQQKSVVANG